MNIFKKKLSDNAVFAIKEMHAKQIKTFAHHLMNYFYNDEEAKSIIEKLRTEISELEDWMK